MHSALLLLPPGGALPGLREMIKRTGIGRTVLEEVLHEAEKNRYLERRPRSGYYRSTTWETTDADLAILLDNSNGQLNLVGAFPQKASYVSRIVLRLQELSQINKKRFFITGDINALPPDIPLFIVGANSDELSAQTQKCSLRAVAVSGHTNCDLQVIPPRERNVCCGLDYLYKLGHRRIGLLFNQQSDFPQFGDHRNEHLFEYYKFMAEHGVKVYAHFLIRYPGEDEIISQLTAALRHEIRPDALLVPSVWLDTVYRVLSEEKLLLPWHISVLGIGTPAEKSKLKPTPTMVFDDPKCVADQAWDLMFSDIEKAYIKQEPQVCAGGSVIRRS